MIMMVSRSWIPATNKFILIYSCDKSAVDRRLNYYSMHTSGLIYLNYLVIRLWQYAGTNTQPFEILLCLLPMLINTIQRHNYFSKSEILNNKVENL